MRPRYTRASRGNAHGIDDMTGPCSAGFDGGAIAVRAQRHHSRGVRDLHPQRIRPRHPKRLDWTAAAGKPGPRPLAQAGGARTQGGTGPDGGRALGRGGVGEKRVRQARRALRTARYRGGYAGTGTAWGIANGMRRRGLPGAHGQGPRAFGSGHCLQSRISHDSFLVGYDWVDSDVGIAVTRARKPHGALYITTLLQMSRASGRRTGVGRAGRVR